MLRALLGVYQLAVGCAAWGVGIVINGWIAMALFEPAKAVEVMAHAFEVSEWPMSSGKTPETTARALLAPEYLLMFGVLSIMPCLIGVRGLSLARHNLQSRKSSEDGE